MAFENEDAEVQGIGDGQEAFDKIMEFKPDIVLADVDMPGLDGFQLSKKIKENPDLANIKVLLLASDFEDFDEDRFNKCQAENHISKPFKSDDIVHMVAQVMEGATVAEIGEEFAIQERVAEKEKNTDGEPSLEELLESVEKLSTDSVDIAKDPIEEPKDFPQPVELEGSAQGIEESEQKKKINEGQLTVHDDDILGGMIQNVQNEIEEESRPEVSSEKDVLDEMTQGIENEIEEKSFPPPSPEKEESVMEDQTFSDEVYAEVQTRKVENLDDLDSAFKEIVAGEKKQQQKTATPKTKESEMSLLGGIIPEPEDLLEIMAPRAFSESGRRPYTEEEINENLNPTDLSSLKLNHCPDSSNVQEMEYNNKDERFIQVTGEQVKYLLEKSLDSSLQEEMSGLSDIIVKTIREVVREITPEIARSVIREEIEKIKNL